MTHRSPLRRRIRATWIAILRMVVHITHRRNTPETIAAGVSIGLFVAFTPTVGLQIVMALALATLFKVNRPAAAAAACVTNPLTIPPLFAGAYWVGKLFWNGPSVREVYDKLTELARELYGLDFYEVAGQFRSLFKMGIDIIVPLTLGGVIVGILLAFMSYPLTKSAVRKYRRWRKRRRRDRVATLRLRRRADEQV